MKVLVIGGNGMLNHQLCQILANGMNVRATFRSTPAQFEFLPAERRLALWLTGLFGGFAIVAKFSYLPVLAPSMAISLNAVAIVLTLTALLWLLSIKMPHQEPCVPGIPLPVLVATGLAAICEQCGYRAIQPVVIG